MTDLYDIRYDTMHLYVHPEADDRIASLIFCTEPNEKRAMKKLKTKNRDAQKKRSVIKSVESVLRPEGSQWWERFVIAVGLEPGVNERGSYGWREW